MESHFATSWTFAASSVSLTKAEEKRPAASIWTNTCSATSLPSWSKWHWHLNHNTRNSSGSWYSGDALAVVASIQSSAWLTEMRCRPWNATPDRLSHTHARPGCQYLPQILTAALRLWCLMTEWTFWASPDAFLRERLRPATRWTGCVPLNQVEVGQAPS